MVNLFMKSPTCSQSTVGMSPSPPEERLPCREEAAKKNSKALSTTNLWFFYIQFEGKKLKGVISKSHQIQELWMISKKSYISVSSISFFSILHSTPRISQSDTKQVYWCRPGEWHWFWAETLPLHHKELCSSPHSLKLPAKRDIDGH